MPSASEPLSSDTSQAGSVTPSKTLIRIVARFLVATVLLYLASRFLIYWHNWPSLTTTIQALSNTDSSIEQSQIYKGIALIMIYISTYVLTALSVRRTPAKSLTDDARQYQNLSYFIVRAAFWAVFLIGLSDAIISFLRVEELLVPVVGERIAQSLDQATQRGLYVHYPLLVLSLIIAWFSRSLGFIWLALLVVLAEFTIVITRFVFSYEQAFMGDLVRFWYAAFFLFASAYTLVEGGHVRVDVVYARVRNRSKAWVNALGSLLLGLPVCWTILHYGMGSRQSSLIAPILSFETSPSGYGMYVKYLMAAFLIIFAVSMAIIFISYFLKSCAFLFNDADAELPSGGEH
jgi:TRAP-type mannitol/chloroaromatic compound transport system permease small subunit